jgi:hypothetical protein
LQASATGSIPFAQADADPTKLATLAQPLKAKVVARIPGAPNVDMMALWPNDTNPTLLIACNEQGSDQVGFFR